VIHSDTQEPSANPVHSEPRIAGSALVAVPSKLSDKHERFVHELMSNGGNLGDAYRAVYPNAGSQASVWAHATRLRARLDVQERIAELTAIAAERALVKPTELLRELYEIACLADPAELSRVVIDPCPACWLDDALAAALDAAAATGAPMPDTEAPRADCKHCRGRGAPRVVITPTHELRGPARRLFQSARQRADGSIEVHAIDQAAMRIELHKLLGMHVSRSVNTNLNVNVDPSKPNPWSGANLTPEQVLQRVRRARAPVTIDQRARP
jgi:hypothetical protein